MAQILAGERVIAFDIRLRFAGQAQRLRRVDPGDAVRFAVDQPVQDVQDMGLGRAIIYLTQ